MGAIIDASRPQVQNTDIQMGPGMGQLVHGMREACIRNPEMQITDTSIFEEKICSECVKET